MLAPLLAALAFLAATSAGELRWIESPLGLAAIGGGVVALAGVAFGLVGLIGVAIALAAVNWLAVDRIGDALLLALQLPLIGAVMATGAVAARRLLAGWQRRRSLAVGSELQRLRSRVTELEAMSRAGSVAEAIGASAESWLPLVDDLGRTGAALLSRLPEGILERDEAKRFAESVRAARRGILAQSAFAGGFRLDTAKEGSLGDAVQRAVAATTELCRAHNVTVETDVTQAGPPCAMDAELLALAVTSLLANAAEASPRGGVISVSAHADYRGERGLVEVTDRGAGIPPDNFQLVFRPFYTTRPGKLGLGLPVAREIVARMGGSIAVTSNETRGMTFKIRIPMRRAELVGEAADREAAERAARAPKVVEATVRSNVRTDSVDVTPEKGQKSAPNPAKEAEIAEIAKQIELARAAATAHRARLEEELE